MKTLAPAVFEDTVDVTQRRGYGTLSSAGWYRAIKYSASSANDANGYKGAVLHLDVVRDYDNTANETHSIDLNLVYDKIEFNNEVSVSKSQGIDKVRYTNNGAYGYVDVHYSLSTANDVTVCFSVAADATEQAKFTAESLQAVADSPSGETVLKTHTFAATSKTPVEYGTANGWDYVLYADKTIEATRTIWQTLSYYDEVRNFFAYYIPDITLPFTMKDTSYYVGATWSIGNGFAISAGLLSVLTTKFNAYALATAGGTSQSVVLTLLLKGKIA